jgi:hypothetical protein
MWQVRASSARHGNWRKENVNEIGAAGEAAARAELERNKFNFVQGVDTTRPASAPGFDAAGLGSTKKGGTDKAHIGEAKASQAKGGYYFPPEKFTATTTNIGTSIDSMRDTVRNEGGAGAVRRLNTALRSGNVAFTIYLVGTANMSAAARIVVSARIRTHLRAYLRSQFGMTVAEANKVVRNVSVDVQRI